MKTNTKQGKNNFFLSQTWYEWETPPRRAKILRKTHLKEGQEIWKQENSFVLLVITKVLKGGRFLAKPKQTDEMEEREYTV